MSTLTKILIILLTISSIFLCGIVVTYVANADNYRGKYNALKSERDSLSKKADSLTKQVNEKIAEKQQLEDNLNSQIATLKQGFEQLQAEFNTVEREKADLLQRVNGLAAIMKDFSKTTDKQGLLLKNTLEELKKVKAEQIEERKELDEVTTHLIEKMAIIETLKAEGKHLLEAKSELQNRLDRLLRPAGKAAAAPQPVTPRKDIAKPAAPIARDIDLKGLVTEVDLKNSIAKISLGDADGVKEGMRFHVTRGDEFICDILIIDVNTEEAIGILELVQQQPKVNDNVATNL